MNSNNGYVVVGSDTGIGKTEIACGIVRRLRIQGQRVGVFKPAASGLLGSSDDDIERLRDATGGAFTADEICPYRFALPVAPLIAADIAGKSIEWAVIWRAMQGWQTRCDQLVVETAGGIYSPLDRLHSNLDFAQQLGLPAVVVVPNRLGAINSAMLVTAALLAREIPIVRVFFNDLPHEECDELIRRTNLELFVELHQRYLRSERNIAAQRISPGEVDALLL